MFFIVAAAIIIFIGIVHSDVVTELPQHAKVPECASHDPLIKVEVGGDLCCWLRVKVDEGHL